MLPEYFAYLTILIGICSVYSYIKSMLSGKAKPNRVTWILWAVAPFVATYVGYKSGVALPVILTTFMVGFTSIPVIILSFFTKGAYWKTTTFDVICGILSVIAIIVWVTTKDGILSLVFAVLADLFAGIPTIIKSWRYSETENATSYAIGILNPITAFLIIKNFSFITLAFPLYVALANTIIILGIKKKYLFKFLKP